MGIVLGFVIFAAAMAIIGYCIKDVGKGNGVRPVGGRIGAIICVSISSIITVGIFIFALKVGDSSLIIGSIMCLLMIGSMAAGVANGNFDEGQK